MPTASPAGTGATTRKTSRFGALRRDPIGSVASSVMGPQTNAYAPSWALFRGHARQLGVPSAIGRRLEPVMHAFAGSSRFFAVGLTGIMSCGEQVVVRETQAAACGNGRADADEQCDDGNLLNDDACTAVAASATASRIRTSPWKTRGTKGVTTATTPMRTAARVACASPSAVTGSCADIAAGEAGYEACDDGNGEDTDGCFNRLRGGALR